MAQGSTNQAKETGGNLAALAALVKHEDDASANLDPGVILLALRKATPANTSGADADYEALQISAGRLWASVVLEAGSAAVGSVITAGDLAHDAADSGNPVKVGGNARTTNPTAVADGDRANLISDDQGRLVTTERIRDLGGNQHTTITSSTAETTIATAVASTFLDLYGLVITNSSATGTLVTIKDSSGGTTRFTFYVPATETRGFMVPVSAAHLQATVNTAWTATCGTSVASVFVTALFNKTT